MTSTQCADSIFKLFEDIASDNAMNNPTTTVSATNNSKKRKRQQKQENKTVKPGWVPKPPENSPLVSWLENENIFTVQNPANKGPLLMKMEFYDGLVLTFTCGLYMEKNSDMHKTIKQLMEKISNLWIDKSSGIPKLPGLTQTVQPLEVIITSNTTTITTTPEKQQQQKRKQRIALDSKMADKTRQPKRRQRSASAVLLSRKDANTPGQLH